MEKNQKYNVLPPDVSATPTNKFVILIYKSFRRIISSLAEAQSIFDRLEKRAGKIADVIGKGLYGLAFQLDNGYILKISTDLAELKATMYISSHGLDKSIRNVYSSGIPEYKDIFLIKMDQEKRFFKPIFFGIVQSMANGMTLADYLNKIGLTHREENSFIDKYFERNYTSGEINSLMEHIGELPKRGKIREIITQLCVYIDYLQYHGVKWIDLHTNNIIVDFDADGEPVVTLIDFGGTTHTNENPDHTKLDTEDIIAMALLPVLN